MPVTSFEYRKKVSKKLEYPAPESHISDIDYQRRQVNQWVNAEYAPILILLQQILEELQNRKG